MLKTLTYIRHLCSMFLDDQQERLTKLKYASLMVMSKYIKKNKIYE